MALVFIFGPPAVGKMAVGQELARLTGLRLFHNHATIELVLPFFQFGEPAFSRLVSDVRRRVMEEVAASDLPGLIFTFVWAFDDPRDEQAVARWAGIFESRGREVFFVELEASQATRIERNSTALRLQHKPSMRDRSASVQRLVALDATHQLNSTNEFNGAKRYLRIDNTKLAPNAAAALIRDTFALPLAADADG